MKSFRFLLILALSAPVMAQTNAPREAALVDTVSVTGTARVRTQPDRFSFTVGVQTQAPTVEERHHSFVAIVESVWRRHSVSLLTELHHRECYAIGLRHACTSYKPNVLRYRKRHYSIAEAEVKLLDRVDAPGK